MQEICREKYLYVKVGTGDSRWSGDPAAKADVDAAVKGTDSCEMMGLRQSVYSSVKSM